jgi:hypothetical protein
VCGRLLGVAVAGEEAALIFEPFIGWLLVIKLTFLDVDVVRHSITFETCFLLMDFKVTQSFKSRMSSYTPAILRFSLHLSLKFEGSFALIAIRVVRL